MEIKIKLPEQKSESALSDLQKEYRKFFRAKLKERGQDHPFEGTEDDIADFFGELSEEWAEYKKSLSNESTSSTKFEDSGEATDFMYTINHMLKDKRLIDWTKDTNKKAVDLLKQATKAYGTYLAEMEEASE